MKKIFLTSFLILLMIGLALSYVENHKAYVKVGKSYIMYYGTVDMSSEAEGNHYTQALFIAEFNEGHGYLSAVCSEVGIEDVDVYVEYSQDLSTWVSGGEITGLNGLGTTMKTDTVDVINGAQNIRWKAWRWIRFKFDGQAGNDDTTVTWRFLLMRNQLATQKDPWAIANTE